MSLVQEAIAGDADPSSWMSGRGAPALADVVITCEHVAKALDAAHPARAERDGPPTPARLSCAALASALRLGVQQLRVAVLEQSSAKIQRIVGVMHRRLARADVGDLAVGGSTARRLQTAIAKALWRTNHVVNAMREVETRDALVASLTAALRRIDWIGLGPAEVETWIASAATGVSRLLEHPSDISLVPELREQFAELTAAAALLLPGCRCTDVERVRDLLSGALVCCPGWPSSETSRLVAERTLQLLEHIHAELATTDAEADAIREVVEPLQEYWLTRQRDKNRTRRKAAV